MAGHLVIVGAGIMGLAHALAGLRAGLRVTVVEREARANGASIRNFGFVTVTGQEQGLVWRRAKRARDVWAGLVGPAGIAVHQRGLLMVARRPEALAVLEEFRATGMGAECRILGRAALAEMAPMLGGDLVGALHSPHELRVESRDAIPQLTAWLASLGVRFIQRAAVRAVDSLMIETTAERISADHIVVCPGPDLVTLFPEIIARRQVTLCKLHMLRVAHPGYVLPAPVMSDLGLVRYLGYAMPSLPALRARLEAEQAAWLADGIHLIAVQSGDGSLVVGDSHHYDPTPDPFQPEAVDRRMLAEFELVTGRAAPDVLERWIGVYPSGPDVAFTETPMPGVRLAMVTSGTGASTAFAIAEETIADMLGNPIPDHARPQ